MKKLDGYQAQYLKGLAHGLKPVVAVGQKGITASLIRSIDAALERHELIKIKFIDFKGKSQKKDLTDHSEFPVSFSFG
ncbi:MAG: YhbY family RNA-binding protein [Desulfobacterales bacterium]|nr:MAG: YhbY family RNA-binding protein [Desulfobacterales bacterium]